MNKKTQKISVLFADSIFINLAWVAFFYVRIETGWFKILIMPEMFLPMIVFYFYWLIVFTFFGMYRTWFASSRFDEISSLFKATFVGIFIIFFVIFISDYIEGVQSSYRILIFIYWFFLFLFIAIGRLFVRSIQRALLIKGIGRKTAVIVGYNSKAREVHDQILEHPALGLDVEAYIAVNEKNVGKVYKNIRVRGTLADLMDIIYMNHVSEVIIALEKEDH
ncbi:MAG: sugar transferase, partial [Ignavibacteriaceae bacterium]|nr:sugar transferase [Ignavibacteriaceae bacterium]